ncbi:A/G-specific adenine glycosylase [Dysgonomonas sp. 511]|uniref:A/G-specific adenine glycosylase n=1 Tax=Dysgonomonas sp. 511 TaxID=2302930 RepID=UPI0013D7BADE|nr:A/G-specific adenine glycosylase [Dysgonomonas sp. 511]NDV78590.1 A/G-specific adenine glycosylase [Dysgonomonas sp. 511]
MHEGDALRLSRILTRWYEINKRDLPWRQTNDPYKIWMSEIILQQTRVDQGYAYYNRFVEKYPTVTNLAGATEEEVLKLWQGLGYYSRARNLHAAAKEIVDRYKGIFPIGYKDVLSLKGVGEYTAAAIVSFAYNEPYAVVDGNVYRVLSRIFAIEEPIDSSRGKKVFAQLAQGLLDKDNPGIHNQAVMEFGALQCVPVSPDCAKCPVVDFCLAHAQNKISRYPVKQNKTKTQNRYFNYLDIRIGDDMFLHKREQKDVWQNLYELPLIETEKALAWEELAENEVFRGLFSKSSAVKISKAFEIKHVLSHQVIYAVFYRIDTDNALLDEKYLKIKLADADRYPVSRLVHKYLEKL